MKKIKAAIIGCGDIAGKYDEHKKGAGIFSHAAAYSSFKNIEIAAAFDPDARRLRGFCKYWKVVKSCASIDQLLAGKYDIVSVCGPDHTHEELLESVILSGCSRYIWAEKPLTTTARAAGRIIKLAERKKTGVLLTLQRRWETEHIAVRERIRRGLIGDVLHVNGYYIKGAVHIGSTMIDTLRFLCGEITWAMAMPPFKEGSYGRDYSLRGVMGFRNGATACILGCDRKKYAYSVFEIDIVGTWGRIKIEENGDRVYYYALKAYDYYSGFNELALKEKRATGMKWSMKRGAEIIAENLAKGNFCLDLAREGLRDLEIVEALKKSAASGGKKIEV